jgi:hypothetical protein
VSNSAPQRSNLVLLDTSRTRRMYAALASILFDFVCLLVSVAQSAATSSVPEEASQIGLLTQTDLYIIFLHLQASDARARASENYRGPTLDSRAARLGIGLGEIDRVDGAANAFVVEDKALRQEAIAYMQKQRAARQPDDPSIIRSFTARREALAIAAFAKLKGQLAPESLLGLQQFLDSKLRPSIKSWR